jgi:hypothetical protein
MFYVTYIIIDSNYILAYVIKHAHINDSYNYSATASYCDRHIMHCFFPSLVLILASEFMRHDDKYVKSDLFSESEIDRHCH